MAPDSRSVRPASGPLPPPRRRNGRVSRRGWQARADGARGGKIRRSSTAVKLTAQRIASPCAVQSCGTRTHIGDGQEGPGDALRVTGIGGSAGAGAKLARSAIVLSPQGLSRPLKGTGGHVCPRMPGLAAGCVRCEAETPNGVQIATNPRESEGGIDAGEPGGGEPTRRLSGGRSGRSRRQSCAARCRRRRRCCPQSCGHHCRARCKARCAAKPAAATHGVLPQRAGAMPATSAAHSAGARMTRPVSASCPGGLCGVPGSLPSGATGIAAEIGAKLRIPVQSGHSFHGKVITDSIPK